MKPKFLLTGIVCLLCAVGFAEATAEQGFPFSLDLRTGARTTEGPETIQWSADWATDDADATVKVSADGAEVLVDGEDGGGASVWCETAPGTYKLAHVTYSNGRPVKRLTAQFVVPETELAELAVTATGYAGVFDGEGHSIQVDLPSGALVSYAGTEDGSYTRANPVFTNVVSTRVWYRVRLPGHQTATGSVPVEITPATFAEGSISAQGHTGIFDGAAHTITVTAPEAATVTYARTPEGPFESENPSFTDVVSTCVWYRVERNGYTTVNGSAPMEITPATLAEGEIVVFGYTGAFDGNAHTISVTVVDGASVAYALSEEGPFTAEPPTFAEAVSTCVWYRVERRGYTTVTASAPVVVGAETDGLAFSLDLRESPRSTRGVETIQWSGLWDSDADATVKLSVNGAALLEGEAGEGVFDWNESTPGTYAFTHVTYQDGKAIKRLTATFVREMLDFLETELQAVGHTGDYDGAAHTITVTAPEAATVMYARVPDGPFDAENPAFTDAVATSVWYCVEQAGYNTVTGSVPMVIRAIDVASVDATQALQRYPWNGCVDIDCTVGFEVLPDVALTVMAIDETTGTALDVRTLSLGAEVVENGVFTVGVGDIRVTWDAAADLDAGFVSTNVTITVTATNPNTATVWDDVRAVSIDLRAEPRVRPPRAETLRYDTRWYGTADATMSIKADGVVIAENLQGVGTFTWDDVRTGTHTLELLTYQGGMLVDTQTATFAESGTTVQGVPFAWLEAQDLISGVDLTRADYEEVALIDLDEDGYSAWQECLMGTDPWDETSTGGDDLDGDGWTRWEEFVVGTDPADATSAGFESTIEMGAAGPTIQWTPDLNGKGEKGLRVYTVLEADAPTGPWTEARGTVGATGFRPDGQLHAKRFYRVRVTPSTRE